MSGFIEVIVKMLGLLLGVLQIQLISAMDAARFTAGCDRLPDIQDSWTIDDE